MPAAMRPQPARRRIARRRVAAAVLATALAASAMITATGFGAVTSPALDVQVGTTVDAVISVTLPASGAIDAGTTQAGITGVSWDGSTLSLGTLAQGDMSTAGLTYLVTTNNPTGYQLIAQNPGSSPVLTNGASSIADYGSTPGVMTAGATTGFGFTADGDLTTDAFLDAQWGTGGTLFRNVPAAPSDAAIGSRPVASDAAGDAYQIIYSANMGTSDTSTQDLAYSGQVNLIATTL